MHKASTNYLKKLTNDFGVWQHATKNEINKSEGYALDDSARALIVFLLYKDIDNAKICLNYIEHSLANGNVTHFYNEYKEPVNNTSSSDDAMALGILSLSFAINKKFQVKRCKQILSKFDSSLFIQIKYIRPLSYLIMANSFFNFFEVELLIAKITMGFGDNRWFEDRLTYANPVIPLALLEYYSTNPLKDNIKTIVQSSIETLEKHMRIGVIPAPVGNREWHILGDIRKDIYGQQPIDAGFMVIMLCRAFEILKNPIYVQKAQEWMEWFYGNNIYKQSLIRKDFACSDGIDEHGLSTNCGAESVIMYLWASKILKTTQSKI